MSELEKWVLGLAALAFAGLAGAFWRHVVEDAKTRERLASLESDNVTTKEEVRSLRQRWHEYRNDTMKEIYAMFQTWKQELIERFQRDKKDD